MQNRMDSIFRPNNEYWKRSRAKSWKGALSGGVGILACANGHAKEVAFSESREIARVAYLGQITNIGSGRVRKL